MELLPGIGSKTQPPGPPETRKKQPQVPFLLMQVPVEEYVRSGSKSWALQLYQDENMSLYCSTVYMSICDAYLVLELLNTTGQDGSDQ